MNSCLKLNPTITITPTPTPVMASFSGQISGYDASTNCYVLDHQFEASCAVSLLVKPQIGDRVCFVEVDNLYFINQILSREDKSAELTLHSQQNIHMIAPQVKFTAFEKLELVSLNKVAIISKDYVMSAANSMIQQASSLIQQVEQFSLTAKGFLRLNGKHQVITAEKDVRIDGKRINMG
jgi:cellobiose-specific phosphotransferase system component IIB